MALAVPRSPRPDPSPALERLVFPHGIAEFVSRYWEQTHLHVRREQNPLLGDYFDQLISVDDVDHFLATICAAGPQRCDSLRMSQGGTQIPPVEFQFNERAGFANFDVERILSLYRNGATIIVNSVQQTLGPVAMLCNDLAGFFGVRVLANVYITPPSRQGFPAHHDNHDVFLLQILGEKNWKFYGSPLPLSRWAERAGALDGATEAQDELSLRAGEALYIPRGLVHEGVASTSTSFHLTIGIHPYTWADLLVDVIGELQLEDVDLRRSVAPQLAAPGDAETLEETAAQLAERLPDGRRLARIVEQRAAETRAASRVPARGRFRTLVDPPAVELTTMLRVPRGEDLALRVDDGEVTLTSREKVVTFPGFVRPHVEALLAGEPTCAAALPAGLDDSGRLVLVRRLVHEGLLETADSETARLR